MGPVETEFKRLLWGFGWIELVQDLIHYLAFVNRVRKSKVP